MKIPDHSHEYQIPVATREEILEGLSEESFVVPKLLGTASLYAYEAFSTAEQGVQAHQASERAIGLATTAKQTADAAQRVADDAKELAQTASNASRIAVSTASEWQKSANDAFTQAREAKEKQIEHTRQPIMRMRLRQKRLRHQVLRQARQQKPRVDLKKPSKQQGKPRNYLNLLRQSPTKQSR